MAAVVTAVVGVAWLRLFDGRPGVPRFPPGVLLLVAEGVVVRIAFDFRAFEVVSVVR